MFSFDYKNAYPNVINRIPKSNLGYNTNNVYPSFPPLMNDGRSVVSSWDPESSLNQKLKNDNHITTNWEYRKYLTKNAISVMEMNYNDTANDTGSTFTPNEKTTSNNPFLYGSINEKPTQIGFENSDLKETYLTREQLYSRKCVPTINAKDLNV